jgi:DNA replication protein DnaD
MAFTSFSAQHIIENDTVISNIFCDEYLPTMHGEVARVYLYGLYKCANADRDDNTLDRFAQILNLKPDEIMDCFQKLCELGLVTILPSGEIKYLPVSSGSKQLKKFNADKYAEFNMQIQSIIRRQILPNELNEYYTFMETQKFDPVALVMIAKYCADLRGADVGYAYILTVAKNWLRGGIKTAAAVEDKLVSHSFDSSAVSAILKKLKSKRMAESEDFALLEKWRRSGFALPIIETIAAYCARVGRKSMEDIDAEITRFHETGLTEVNEIENYINEMLSKDKQIKTLLTRLGLDREVVPIDRDFYNTWTQTWKFTPEIIDHAAAQSVGKQSPLNYMNKILSTYFDKNIKTLDAARQTNISYPTQSITRHSYAGDEIEKIIKNRGEIKL